MEDINNLIINRKIEMEHECLMTEKQGIINQMMYGLDLVRHRSEMKWGIGRLVDLADESLRARWGVQVAKLEGAILAGDVALVEDLVASSKRGWAALEKSAIAGGHVPYSPEFKEVAMDDGTVYRVVGDNGAAEALASVWGGSLVTVEELCRVYHARHQETFTGAGRGVVNGEWKPGRFVEGNLQGL